MKELMATCLILSLVVAGCASGKPFDPELVGRDFYLCCNLRFNQDHDANDANYAYPGDGTTIPFGSQVRVTEVAANSIRIQPAGDTSVFWLGFKFGRERISPAEYFRNILHDTDPRETLTGIPPEIMGAIGEGQLLVGMTKEQALLARGYPPFHRTTGVEADEWIYYYSRGLVDRVRFIDGKLASIDRGSAPQ